MIKFDFDDNFDKIENGERHCVVQECISLFDCQEKDKENTTKYIFSNLSNNKLEIVLAKVVVLNEFYSTQLNSNPPIEIKKDHSYHMDVVSMAKHIIAWDKFDEYCCSADIEKRQEAVNYIRCGDSDYREPYHKEAYSFATKYCSWHNPNGFPIVDSYSRGMIYYLNRNLNFYKRVLTQESLNVYSVFCEAYDALSLYLQNRDKQFEYRDIDKFLWYYGKKQGIAL